MVRIAFPLAAACAVLATAALAQSPPGTVPGHEPVSQVPTNTAPGNTHTPWSPSLPTPPVPENAPPAAFLSAARQAIATNHTGEAQEALERAESRALDRAVRPSTANQPSQQPLVHQIAEARQALAAGDRARTLRLIDAALHNPDASRKE